MSDSMLTPVPPAPFAEEKPPETAILTEVRDPAHTDWDRAWFGMEPTFTNRKTLKLWRRFSRTEKTEVKFFNDRYVLKMQERVVRAMERRYKKGQRRGESWCFFDKVEREEDVDQWGVRRQNLHFRCRGAEPAFTVRFGLDPEVFEYSIKPVPVEWLYDPRFVQFLQELVWEVPLRYGLVPTMGHGGCQFSLSAKTYLQGSLLCDDIADRFNHPELSCFSMDFPNCDDRSFRATKARRAAFLNTIEQFWSGAFHPRAIGSIRVENAILDRGFLPAFLPPPDLMSREHASAGPVGTLQDVFQNNFAFARAVRLLAQNIHPGYWQGAHPDSLGYRPDQIMRYSEGNLNRLRIMGELHVKSDKVLDPHDVPEFDAELLPTHLYHEASWENRAQTGRTSARDFVEALLLDVHRAKYLQKHPVVSPRRTLLQDRLLADAEETLVGLGGNARLDELRAEARKHNADESRGRIRSDFIEPETLFWEVYFRLPETEVLQIAREAVSGFVNRATEAATCDPRFQDEDDPMEWHRHRIHPLLWEALSNEKSSSLKRDVPQRELRRFLADKDRYLARRPCFSVGKDHAPWETARQRIQAPKPPLTPDSILDESV
ncbi:MAG TPA: hypothetical protein PKE31_11025 [Pseudomonadota bacterium]|nr:hypothetical protein [Pseudomonadota bacterium]